MPSKVYDRDEWLRQRPQRRAHERAKFAAQVKASQRTARQGLFKDLWQAFWGGAFRLGMYSNDPEIARIGMIQTAEREIAAQRQIAAANRAQDLAREEAHDQARDDEMRRMARLMAQEMFDEAERRKAQA